MKATGELASTGSELVDRRLVVFLFTDVEDQGELLLRLGAERYHAVSNEHRRLIRSAFERFGGREPDVGDPGFVAFEDGPSSALSAACEILRSIRRHPDPDVRGLRIRIGVHRGEAIRLHHGFVGLEVHRAARISAVAHAGQVLVSQETVAASRAEGTDQFVFRDLGRHRLKDLGEPQRLFQLVVEGVENNFPPPRSLEAFPTNLPIQLTPFIGRESEVERVSELVRGSGVGGGLVTLVGPGGIGKTRLALQAAASLIEEFEDGVYFVGLASIQDPDYVLSAVAQAIGVSETGGSLFDAVTNFLGAKQLLLVLDNFEHVISAAPVIDSLLDQAPGLRVLATSRTHLKIKEEQEYSVEPFSVPQPDRLPSIDELARFDSISLFIDRAQAVNPRFSLTTTNAKAITGICARVDGIALAIELAAARTKLFTPQALLARLDKQLPVLKGSHRDVSSRQMTLKNTIEWSYNLLHDNEKTLLNRLAVFTGGFTSEAARQVCDPNTQLNIDKSIPALLENNLIQKRQTADTEEPRFYMLSLINEFAYNQLKNNQEAHTAHLRHTDYYVQLAEQKSDEWWSTGSGSAINSIQRDDPNLRAALDWTINERDDNTSLRLIAACAIPWTMHNPLHQVKPKIEPIVNRTSTEHSVDVNLIANGLLAAAYMSLRQADFEQIDRYARQILALPADQTSARTQSIAWYLLGAAIFHTDSDFDSAQLALNRASELAEATSTAVISNWSRIVIAQAQIKKGRYQEARGVLTELIPRLIETGDAYSTAVCHESMGEIEVRKNRPQRAFPHLVKVLDICVDNRLIHIVESCLISVATALQQQDASLLAVKALSQAELLHKQQGVEATDNQDLRDLTLTTLRNSLSKQEFNKAWEEGQKLSLDQTVELVKTRPVPPLR